MPGMNRGPLVSAIERLLPRMKYPWLFVALAAMFVLDLVIPDPIPILDEAVLALLTVLIGGWRTRRVVPTEPEASPGPREIGPGTDAGDAGDR